MVDRRFYKVDEVARYLGFSGSGIRKWVRRGQIPFKKINGGIRFDIHEIEKWVAKSRRSIHDG